MSGFIEGEDRTQATLFPERIDDYIAEENAVNVEGITVASMASLQSSGVDRSKLDAPQSNRFSGHSDASLG